MCFPFRSGLSPGLYFSGGEILSFAGQERSFVQRVMDYRALRVVESRAVQVIGACSLAAKPAELKLAPTLKPPVPRPATAGT